MVPEGWWDGWISQHGRRNWGSFAANTPVKLCINSICKVGLDKVWFLPSRSLQGRLTVILLNSQDSSDCLYVLSSKTLFVMLACRFCQVGVRSRLLLAFFSIVIPFLPLALLCLGFRIWSSESTHFEPPFGLFGPFAQKTKGLMSLFQWRRYWPQQMKLMSLCRQVLLQKLHWAGSLEIFRQVWEVQCFNLNTRHIISHSPSWGRHDVWQVFLLLTRCACICKW